MFFGIGASFECCNTVAFQSALQLKKKNNNNVRHRFTVHPSNYSALVSAAGGGNELGKTV